MKTAKFCIISSIFATLFLVGAAPVFAQYAAKPKQDNPAKSHVSDCAKMEGINKARCERHETMAEKCGPIKGDAHFACDRDYLIVNPLACSKLAGKDGESCKAEVAAFKTCEANLGREFMKCVYKATGESPMGH